MIEGETNFDDLPSEDTGRNETTREQIARRVPCVEKQRHVFLPHETACLCGVLERGVADDDTRRLPWMIAVWPTDVQST